MTEPSSAKSAWDDAGERLSGLGRTFKGHYEDQHGAGADETRAEVADALKRVADAVQDTFDALGRAAGDPEVRTEVKEVGQSLTTALGLSFAGVSDDLRRVFNRQVPKQSSEPPEPEGTPEPD